MKNKSFKYFKDNLNKIGVEECGWAGFAFMDLTERQVKIVKEIAQKQGIKLDENGGLKLANGIILR